MAPCDYSFARFTTFGTAFLALAAVKPEEAGQVVSSSDLVGNEFGVPSGVSAQGH